MRFTLRRATLAASGVALGLGGSTAWCNGHDGAAAWSPPPAENPSYTSSSAPPAATTSAPAPAPAAAAAPAATPAASVIDVAALVDTLRTELRHLTAEGARAMHREEQRAVESVQRSVDLLLDGACQHTRNVAAAEVVRLAASSPELQALRHAHVEEMKAAVAAQARAQVSAVTRQTAVVASIREEARGVAAEAKQDVDAHIRARVNTLAAAGVLLYAAGAATVLCCLNSGASS